MKYIKKKKGEDRERGQRKTEDVRTVKRTIVMSDRKTVVI